ncbi:type II toxin-antitoxin system RelE/ParE family toxin [Flavobacterium sp. PS2]|uniref:type II toxin-antitoxin system RelE/ParE family toxin n=1 Tax=Flavobacterium sp. PS2 TaxID=3384157 RepID=UPI00390CC15B
MIQIIWTESAKLDYWGNIEYLEREWTLTNVYSFIDKTNDLIELLIKENLVFKPTKYKNIFQVPVTKQIVLFYKVLDNNDIELLRFWNAYQDPKSLML